MHFFAKPPKRSNESSRSNLRVQNQSVERKVLKKIIVKKKPRQVIDQVKDHIIQTQSQHLLQDNSSRSQVQTMIVKQNENRHRKNPFVSFMASQNQQDGLQTPYLHASTPNYNLQTFQKKSMAQSIEQVEDQHERNLARTKSKPIEPIKLQSPHADQSMIRRNSMRTDFKTYAHKMNKYPTEISSQPDDSCWSSHNNFKLENQEHPNLELNNNFMTDKGLQRSGLRMENNDSSDRNEPFSEKSTKFNLRQDYSRANTYDLQPLRNTVSPRNDIIRSNTNDLEAIKHITQLAKQIPTIPITTTNNLSIAIDTSRSNSQPLQGPGTRRSENSANEIIPQLTPYASYIQKQAKQLQEQRQRMIYYAEEANKLICNADGYDYVEHHNELIVDKHFLPLKYMIEEMVELFAIAEVIKYELRYRPYEILTKIFSSASSYYGQALQFQQPIKVNTFALAIKALLHDYQKSQLDIVVTRIFHEHQTLSFDQFFEQFASILNSKQVALLYPASMKKELDRTLDKVKRLCVVWIQLEYYTKKVKEILRTSKVVYDCILLECTNPEEDNKLDIELVEKFFLQNQKKNPIKRLKVDLFFRHLIGDDLLKSKWIDWIHKDDLRLYKRYDNKVKYERKQYVSQYNKSGQKRGNNTQKTTLRPKHDFKITYDDNVEQNDFGLTFNKSRF